MSTIVYVLLFIIIVLVLGLVFWPKYSTVSPQPLTPSEEQTTYILLPMPQPTPLPMPQPTPLPMLVQPTPLPMLVQPTPLPMPMQPIEQLQSAGADWLVPGANPDFKYPTQYQYPPGNQWWGYRNPDATLQTLLWQQDMPARYIPDPNPIPQTDYLSMSVPSEPVEKACNPCQGNRPVVPHSRPRPVDSSPYANWASTLQP